MAAAAVQVATARSYQEMVTSAFLLGLAGSSFAVGVGFVSGWFPKEKQGTALGVCGLGNMSHSLVLIPFALLLTWPSMIPFTAGALGAAALLGAGNGAVFKLVPQYFPARTATVTG